MRASSPVSAQPQPLPLPPPPLSLPSSPAAAPPRRRSRHRASTSSSVSSTSSSSSFCPSPSPATSPRASAASSSLVVPFSWERHPGVPKTSPRGGSSPTAGAPLPLPPAPLLRHDNVADADSSDPFVAAFAECTREEEDGRTDHHHHGTDAADRMWLARTKPAAKNGRAEPRRWLAGGGGLVGFLDMYGCKSAVAVADGAFLARRRVLTHGRASRR